MYAEDKILVGCNENMDVFALPKMSNRHGVIAGATGTGKTVTLKVLAESFSDMGVPVFLADMKGDVSGLAKVGSTNDFIARNVEAFSLEEKGFNFKSYPVEFWDLFGEKGLPIRVTLSEMGPMLLSKILNLSEAQEGVLNIIFRVADDESLLIIDLKDLKAMINHVVENKDKYESQYGAISPKSANTILRTLIAFEDQGGNLFFGEGKTAMYEEGVIGCGGIRVYGKDHVIRDNYMEGLTGYKWDPAIALTNGDATNSVSTAAKHFLPENVVVSGNTFVRCAATLEVGFTNNDKYSKKPKSCRFEDNLIVTDTQAVTIHTAMSNTNIVYADNRIYLEDKGTVGMNYTASQFTLLAEMPSLPDIEEWLMTDRNAGPFAGEQDIPDGVEQIIPVPSARSQKYLINGNLYIKYKETMYDVQGKVVDN